MPRMLGDASVQLDVRHITDHCRTIACLSVSSEFRLPLFGAYNASMPDLPSSGHSPGYAQRRRLVGSGRLPRDARSLRVRQPRSALYLPILLNIFPYGVMRRARLSVLAPSKKHCSRASTAQPILRLMMYSRAASICLSICAHRACHDYYCPPPMPLATRLLHFRNCYHAQEPAQNADDAFHHDYRQMVSRL